MNVSSFFLFQALMVDRMFYMICVNSFWVFDMVFKFATNFIEKKNQKRMKVLSGWDKSALQKMEEFIDIENIPSYLGGKNEV